MLFLSIQDLLVKEMRLFSITVSLKDREKREEHRKERENGKSVRAYQLANRREAQGSKKDSSMKSGRLGPENEGVTSIASGW